MCRSTRWPCRWLGDNVRSFFLAKHKTVAGCSLLDGVGRCKLETRRCFPAVALFLLAWAYRPVQSQRLTSLNGQHGIKKQPKALSHGVSRNSRPSPNYPWQSDSGCGPEYSKQLAIQAWGHSQSGLNRFAIIKN